MAQLVDALSSQVLGELQSLQVEHEGPDKVRSGLAIAIRSYRGEHYMIPFGQPTHHS